MERKRFSKRREAALWQLVDNEITEFRISVLKGFLEGYNASGKEDRVYAKLGGLADLVVELYRSRLDIPKLKAVKKAA